MLQNVVGPFARAERQAGAHDLTIERQARTAQDHRVGADLTDDAVRLLLPPGWHLAVAEPQAEEDVNLDFPFQHLQPSYDGGHAVPPGSA